MSNFKKTRKILYTIIVILVIAIGIATAFLLIGRMENNSLTNDKPQDKVQDNNQDNIQDNMQLNEDGLFVTESLYYDLYYPVEWQDKVIIEEELNVVHFCARHGDEIVDIFDIVAIETDKGKIEAHIVMYDVETDHWSDEEKAEVNKMKNDSDHIVDYLKKQKISVVK